MAGSNHSRIQLRMRGTIVWTKPTKELGTIDQVGCSCALSFRTGSTRTLVCEGTRSGRRSLCIVTDRSDTGLRAGDRLSR